MTVDWSPSWPLSPWDSAVMTPSELRQFRILEMNATQATAARVLGVSVDTIRAWEQGKYPISHTAIRLIVLWRRYIALKQGDQSG